MHLKPFDSLAAAWFVVLNLTTFLAFGFDKWRARRSGSRVPEMTLVLLGAIGGWLGGWGGMNLFRHKTIKWTFKLKYVLALIPFSAEIWACWHWR